MGKEFIVGKMEDNMKESISMIKNMGMGFIDGLIKESIKGIGLMESDFFCFFCNILCN